jgi:hypothetical protein
MTGLAIDRVDEVRAYAAHLFTYYAVFIAALILPIAVLADQLVRLASGQFGEAATIVPLTTLSVAGHGWFIFAYRNARLPKQMFWMIGLSLSSALMFVIASVLLIPSLGAVGAPVAAIATWGIVTFIMLGANQLIGEAIPFEYRNLLTLIALSLAVWFVAGRLVPDTTAGTALRLVLLLGWAVALFAIRIVPLSDMRAAGRFLRDASGIDSRRELRRRIASLDGTDSVLIDELVRGRRSAGQAAERTGLSEEEAVASTVHLLRRAAGGGEPKESDAALGTLLLLKASRSERDVGIMRMVTDGADPIDIDLIKRAAAAARPGWRRSR